LLRGGRTAQDIVGVSQLAVPPLWQLEHGQLALGTALFGIGRQASDLGKHAPTCCGRGREVHRGRR
jgi:hypothetical protein